MAVHSRTKGRAIDGREKKSRVGFSFVLVTELLRSSSHKSFRGNSYSVIRNCFPLIYDLVSLLGKLYELSQPEKEKHCRWTLHV